MNMTREFIELIESEPVLRKNAIQQAHSTIGKYSEAETGMRAMLESLADEEATPWFSWSIAQIIFDSVDWTSVIMHFEVMKIEEETE